MTPLPAALGGKDLVGWRLDDARFASTWDSGEGAFLFGGRWNDPGRRVVYAALDPSTAILEVAVHSGFAELAARPHVLTSFAIFDPAAVLVCDPQSAALQQIFGAGATPARCRAWGNDTLDSNRYVALPSAVSPNSWNLLVSLPATSGDYRQLTQEPLRLDPRLVRE